MKRGQLFGVTLDRPRGGFRGGRLVIALQLSVLVLTGCEVTNPGPVQDDFLDDPTTHEGLVRGAERNLLIAGMRIYFASATITREIFPGGDTNSHSPRLQAGTLPSEEMDDYWIPVQQARFIAEDALDRFQSGDVDADPELVARAMIWAGFANKLLGENFCEIVINGGEGQPPSAALQRAEAHFTAAITAAQTAEQTAAAYAGRAQTRVELGNWDGAIADAGMVPDDFVLEIDLEISFLKPYYVTIVDIS